MNKHLEIKLAIIQPAFIGKICEICLKLTPKSNKVKKPQVFLMLYIASRKDEVFIKIMILS